MHTAHAGSDHAADGRGAHGVWGGVVRNARRESTRSCFLWLQKGAVGEVEGGGWWMREEWVLCTASLTQRYESAGIHAPDEPVRVVLLLLQAYHSQRNNSAPPSYKKKSFSFFSFQMM